MTTYVSPPLQSPPSTRAQNIKAQDMILNFTGYEDPNRNTVVYGREILLNPTVEPSVFSWDKLVDILETRIKFVDFKECLVFNYHHIVEKEDELNEGILGGFYRVNNDVIIAKLNPKGRLPTGLITQMKAARKALWHSSVG
jgi:hypothetical protein